MAASSQTSIKASCHCGDVTITVPGKPEVINECKCTLCRRYGVAWGYWHSSELEIAKKRETRKYIWGDRDLEFHFCENCGCVMYWWRIIASPDGTHEVGVNTRNMDPRSLEFVKWEIDYAQLIAPQGNASAVPHPDDLAKYMHDKPT